MSTSSNDETTLTLSRFEKGYAPIVLEKGSTHKIPCELLEDALDDPLDPSIDFPVDYPQQEDALLLHCRFPRTAKKETDDAQSPLSSITGLPEEFEGSSPLLNLSVYQGRIDSARSLTKEARVRAE